MKTITVTLGDAIEVAIAVDDIECIERLHRHMLPFKTQIVLTNESYYNVLESIAELLTRS